MRLSDRFAAGHGAPIEVDGRLVQMMYEFGPVGEPVELGVELHTSSPRAQGLRFKASGGALHVNGQTLDDVVLWSDTAPPVTNVGITPAAPAGRISVRAWNVWRDAADAVQAWIGDAGIHVELVSERVVVLHCSDGFDAPTFDDLTVTLTMRAE